MGATCSKCQGVVIQAATGDPCGAGARTGSRQDSPDPAIYDLMRRSVACSMMEQQQKPNEINKCSSTEPFCSGQHQLLYKHQRKEKQGNNNSSAGGADSQLTVAPQQEAAPTNMRAGAGTPAADDDDDDDDDSDNSSSNDNYNGNGENGGSGGGEMKRKKLLKRTHLPPTRLLVRRHTLRHYEEGLSGTHIYAIRYPTDQPLILHGQQGKEQHDNNNNKHGYPSQEQARHQQPSLQEKLQQQQNQQQSQQQQQYQKKRWIRDKPYTIPSFKDGENIDHLFRPSTMAAKPKQQGKNAQELQSVAVSVHVHTYHPLTLYFSCSFVLI